MCGCFLRNLSLPVRKVGIAAINAIHSKHEETKITELHSSTQEEDQSFSTSLIMVQATKQRQVAACFWYFRLLTRYIIGCRGLVTAMHRCISSS